MFNRSTLFAMCLLSLGVPAVHGEYWDCSKRETLMWNYCTECVVDEGLWVKCDQPGDFEYCMPDDLGFGFRCLESMATCEEYKFFYNNWEDCFNMEDHLMTSTCQREYGVAHINYSIPCSQ